MRTLVKFLFVLLVLVAIVVGGAWVWAGRQTAPTFVIRQPGKFVGQATSLDMIVEAPGGNFSRVDVAIEQNGKSFPVFALGESASAKTQADRLYIMRPIGKAAIPTLQPGPARITVHVARPVLYGLRELSTTGVHDVSVRLEPPRVAILSTKHYINQGGAEFIVYRATPADVESGVRVGTETYPGFPASGAGIPGDASTRVAVFALLHDQDVNAPISVYARDEAGNEATTPVDRVSFPKPFAKSRIEVDDRFLQRVVPSILSNTPDMKVPTPTDLVSTFVEINSRLRQRNAETIAQLSAKTAPRMMWKEPFQQLGNSQVESGFADRRTYFYKGKEIDQQTHLGFDLAVTANVPISSAQRGTVVFADYLGIYGNCVIVDHGLGVESLYAHLSSIDVKPGAAVDKGQILGRSGMTGLAGGDHLHFTMLVHGRPVNPVEWWDSKWMQDRVLRKISEAGGTP
jgi:murein DD-endopeptidase MepM/ murein hydrolase activator NlpD